MRQLGRLTRIIPNMVCLVVVLILFGATANARVIASAGSVNFPDQLIGTTSGALNITLTNTSKSPTTVISVSLSLSVFSVSGLSLPMTLAPGQSVAVAIVFVPLMPQAYSDTLVFARDFGSATYVSVSETGIAPLPLNSSSPALSFGNVAISSSASQSVTLVNAGNSDITISSVIVSGAGFVTDGISAGLILSAGQAATLTVTFDPSSSGSVTGSVTVASNATNSPVVTAISGAGIHTVSLSWTPSTSVVIGYNSYSSTVSGGPYERLNASPEPPTSYTDNSVHSGVTYYYVITAVDSNGLESPFSQEVSASVP
jgi:hypothetical protein